jgi:hypothetical protein
MNKYIRKKSGSYLKRGYYKRKFKAGKSEMQDLIELYLHVNWKGNITVTTYKNK